MSTGRVRVNKSSVNNNTPTMAWGGWWWVALMALARLAAAQPPLNIWLVVRGWPTRRGALGLAAWAGRGRRRRRRRALSAIVRQTDR